MLETLYLLSCPNLKHMRQILLLIHGLFLTGLLGAQTVEADLAALNTKLDRLKAQQEAKAFLGLSKRARALAEKIYGTEDSIYLRQWFREIEGYQSVGQSDLALSELEKAVALLDEQYGRKSVLYLDMAEMLYSLYVPRGDFKKAEQLLSDWEPVVRQLYGKKSWPYGNWLDAQMVVQAYQGNFEEALQPAELYKALLEHLDRKETEDYAFLVNNLGYLYEAVGKTDEAEALYLASKSLRVDLYGSAHPSYGVVLSNLGLLYLRTGRYEQANQYLSQSEQILSSAKPASEEHLTTLHNLASLYQYQDSLEQARRLYEKIIYLSEDIPLSSIPEADRKATAQNLAAVYIELQEWKKAEAIYAKQVETAATKESRLLALQGWLSLGLRQGDYESAAKRWAELQKLQRGKAQWAKNIGARTWRLAGEYYLADMEYDSAAHYFFKAMKQYLPELASSSSEQLPTFLKGQPPIASAEIWRLLRKYQDYYEQRYIAEQVPLCLERGLALAEASLENARKRIGQIVSPRDRLKLLGDQRFFTAAAVRNCWRLWEQSGEKKYLERAFFLTEQNKAQLIATALQSNQARVFGSLPDSLAQQERHLTEGQSQLTKALFEVQDSASRLALREQLAALDLELQALYQQVASNYPDYYRLRYAAASFSLADLQAALRQQDLLLSYFKDDEQLYVFEVNQEGLEARRQTIAASEWEEHYNTYRNMLSDFERAFTSKLEDMQALAAESHWWYQRLLAPTLKGYPTTEHLIIVGDAQLHHLPFEALTTEPLSGKERQFSELPYLLKTQSSSYSYSVALWLEAQRYSAPSGRQELLAIAPKHSTVAVEGGLSALSPYLDSLRRSLVDLPAVEEEVKGLLEQVDGQALWGESASEQKLKSLAGDYGILHFATHGILNEQYPILSSLALTPTKDSLQDDFLQAYEIAQWDLNAELVVLSACETGYGRFEQGEGVMSLARAFLYARVPALLVSLWQVNDQSTAILMRFFYEALAEGLDKAAALREAKLRFLKNAKGRSGHPAYWAAFIQLGNSRAVELARPSSFWGSLALPIALGGGAC